jgi:hypothetical protein
VKTLKQVDNEIKRHQSKPGQIPYGDRLLFFDESTGEFLTTSGQVFNPAADAKCTTFVILPLKEG